MRPDALFQGDLARQLDQLGIVWGAHIGIARAKGVVVRADQRIIAHEIDVVLDHHEIALAILRVHAAGCSGDHQRLHSQRTQHPQRQGDLLHRVPFVIVEPAGERGHGLAGQLADDEFPGVGVDGRLREVGNFSVGDDDFLANLRGQFAQPGAENNADRWFAFALGPYDGHCFVNLAIEFTGRVDVVGHGTAPLLSKTFSGKYRIQCGLVEAADG